MSPTPAITIQPFASLDAEHMELLLEADPSVRMVHTVFAQADAHEIRVGEVLAGVMLLVRPGPEIMEIANISVARSHRRQGLGRKLIERAQKETVRLGCGRLEVGTGSTSLEALLFYQICGFRMDSIERDHFVGRYDQPVVEHGITLTDMVRLSWVPD